MLYNVLIRTIILLLPNSYNNNHRKRTKIFIQNVHVYYCLFITITSYLCHGQELINNNQIEFQCSHIPPKLNQVNYNIFFFAFLIN